jgi:hypothetical protein
MRDWRMRQRRDHVIGWALQQVFTIFKVMDARLAGVEPLQTGAIGDDGEPPMLLSASCV